VQGKRGPAADPVTQVDVAPHQPQADCLTQSEGFVYNLQFITRARRLDSIMEHASKRTSTTMMVFIFFD
jgi:hypothetical protein